MCKILILEPREIGRYVEDVSYDWEPRRTGWELGSFPLDEARDGKPDEERDGGENSQVLHR